MKRNLEHKPDRVLVINANIPKVTIGLRRKVCRSGYKIILASDSYEGIKLFRLNPDKYRIIIIDIGIKNIHGIDLAKLILDLDLNPALSVIIHSLTGDMIIKSSKKGIRVKKLSQNLFTS